MFQEVRGIRGGGEEVGALGNWASGIREESGNAGDGMKGTEGWGSQVGRQGSVGNFWRSCFVCLPPASCGEDCGLAEEECAGGGLL